MCFAVNFFEASGTVHKVGLSENTYVPGVKKGILRMRRSKPSLFLDWYLFILASTSARKATTGLSRVFRIDWIEWISVELDGLSVVALRSGCLGAVVTVQGCTLKSWSCGAFACCTRN